jgi:hypothetical protein
MRVLLVFLVVLGFSIPAAAQTEAERAAVQNIIEQQLQAFLRDDATTAYSFAAPGIKAMFPNEGIFMQMVQQGYPQVYRPRSHEFGELVAKGRGLEQTVDLVDADGEFWTALYTLEMQPDGSWKITGCYIVKKPGEVA